MIGRFEGVFVAPSDSLVEGPTFDGVAMDVVGNSRTV